MRKTLIYAFTAFTLFGCGKQGSHLQPLTINYLTESSVPAPGGNISLSANVNAPRGVDLYYMWTVTNGFSITTGGNSMTVEVFAPYTYGTTGTATVTVTYRGSSHPFTTGTIRLDTQASTGPITLQTNAPWPKYMQNIEQTGLSGVDTSSTTGTLKWKSPIGKQCDSPTIDATGTIYIICTDNGVLYAIDSTSGLKWTFTTGWNNFKAGGVGPLEFTTGSFNTPVPAIGSDGTIYATGYSADKDETLYALNQNGALKWSYRLGVLYSSYYSYHYIPSSPAIGADGTVYVAIFGVMFAINSNGTLKMIDDDSNTNCSLYNTPAIDTNGILYVTGLDVCAINPNGTSDWSAYRNYGGLYSLLSPPTIGTNGTIYFTTGMDYEISGSLLAASNGYREWLYSDSDIADTYLTAPAVESDGTIYFGTANGLFYAINPDGSLKWAYVTGVPIQDSPAIGADGTIYVGDSDGKLYAFTPQGLPKWTYQTGGAIDSSSPAIGADGTIYVASDDGYLYAIH